jgi:hypothetical protein
MKIQVELRQGPPYKYGAVDRTLGEGFPSKSDDKRVIINEFSSTVLK